MRSASRTWRPATFFYDSLQWSISAFLEPNMRHFSRTKRSSQGESEVGILDISSCVGIRFLERALVFGSGDSPKPSWGICKLPPRWTPVRDLCEGQKSQIGNVFRPSR